MNRRLHYRVELINNHAFGGCQFRPIHVDDTIFRCMNGYTRNNPTVLGWVSANHNPNHDQMDISVPLPPDTTLNERLATLNWGHDNAPSYTLGGHPGGGVAIRTALDGAGHVVPNMFIHT